VAVVWFVVSPWWSDTTTFGFHDWDTVTAFRYLVTLSLREYGEFPGFNPYHCGGYPSWGYAEGATNLVSPWLPVYLYAPINQAIRIETLGMGLVGAVGSYVLAGRFTKSSAARLLVVALWAVNGRWGLQAAAGHTWHLAYGWLPWVFYCYERARERDASLRWYIGCGVSAALLVYSGGIYPLPHTALLLGLYAAVLSLVTRTVRPIWVLTLCGITGCGLAAPKLFPLLETLAVDPRVITSTERLDIGAFVTLLTHPEQPFHGRPARVHPYGWHEWGMYISWCGAWVLVAGVALAKGTRETALKLVGGLFVVLGFGAFHPRAPWVLLHELPIFRSQHVPSRFLYPAVLLLGLVAASWMGKAIDRRRRRMPWLDSVAVLLVMLLAVDIARVAQQPMRAAMWMRAPRIERAEHFAQHRRAPVSYRRNDWAAPMLLSMAANAGVLDCYGVPRGDREVGAVARSDPRHRGLAFVEPGGATAVTSWSPNSITARVDDAPPNARLVYNMNYWDGWRATVSTAGVGERALAAAAHQHRVSVPVPEGASVVRLRYEPPGLRPGLVVFGGTLLVLLFIARRRVRECG